MAQAKAKHKKQYWLMKSEPSTYSLDHLIAAKNQTTAWEGVRNYQARNFLKNDMHVGDEAFFYHSSCSVPAIVGIVEVIKAGYPDETAFDPKSDYYDPDSKPEAPRWFRVDVKFKKKISPPITLSELKKNPLLADFILTQRGNRLSVMPVTLRQWQTILHSLK